MAVTSANNLRQGSKGDDVLELQKLLNQNGYSLAEDGSFGPATLSAVKDYQQKNGLAVDGIVGTNTWGKLTGTSGTATDGATTPEATVPEATEAPKFEYTPYAPSDTVKQAEALLQQQLANKPGEYTSPWQSQLTDIINQINNREKFSYDMNADALYQQYKDQYTTQGKMAMMDTMGQAQAMTGGYGNSYAQSVGQQAYQGYLQNLNDKIPELYQLALNQYNAEGDALYNQASLIAGMEDRDYGRHRDQMSDYYTDLDRMTDDSRYKAEQEYQKWADDQSFRYQQERDKTADEQWQAQFDEAVRQFNQTNGVKSGGSSSGGSSGGGSSSGGSGGGGLKYDEEAAKKQRELVAAGYDIEVDGKWGPKSKAAWADYQSGKGGGGGSFTGSTYSEACSYLKSKGQSVGGLMTKSEWQRRKSAYNQTGQGGTEVTAYSSYEAYLKAYVKYATQ